MSYRQRMEQETLRRAIAAAVVRSKERGRPPADSRERMDDLITRFVLDGGRGGPRQADATPGEEGGLRSDEGKPPRPAGQRVVGLPSRKERP